MNETSVIEVPQASYSRRDDRSLQPMQSGGAMVTGATGLLQAITAAASNPAVDIEKMERLFAMHQKIVAQEAEQAFNDALARAQKNIQPVVSDAKNDHTSSRYATLGAINKQIVPLYTAEGLSLSFNTADSPIKDFLRIEGTLSHSGGHSRKYHIDLPPDDVGAKGNVNKTGVQATGSTNSYGRRYLALMIFNVSTMDDTDGNKKDKKEEVIPDPEGKKALEACGSMGALQEAWKALTAQQRSTLAGVKEEMKAKIQAANKASQA